MNFQMEIKNHKIEKTQMISPFKVKQKSIAWIKDSFREQPAT